MRRSILIRPGLTFSEFAIVLSWELMPHYWLRLLKTKETNSKNNCVCRSVTLTSPLACPPQLAVYTPLLAVGFVSPLKVFPCQGLKDLVEGKSHEGVTPGWPGSLGCKQCLAGVWFELRSSPQCTGLVWFLSKIPITLLALLIPALDMSAQKLFCAFTPPPPGLGSLPPSLQPPVVSDPELS